MDYRLEEVHKSTSRTEVLNFILSQLKRETTYLEIGVCNPFGNYNLNLGRCKIFS